MVSKVQRAITGNIVLAKKKRLKERPLGVAHKVVGFDIEADAESAAPYLLTMDDGIGTAREIACWEDVTSVLCRISHRNTVNFFYNLQYDFEGLLKLLRQDVAVRMYGGLEARIDDGGRIDESCTSGWIVKYVPKKAFRLQRIRKGKGNETYTFFDLWQYFMASLGNAVKKNIPGEAKGDFDAKFSCKALYEGKISVEEYLEMVPEAREEFEKFGIDTWIDYRKVLTEYALGDSRVCRLLGELIVKGVNQFVNTKSFYSSARVSEDFFRSKGFEIPEISVSVHKDFMRSYHGGRFEMVKRGFIPGASVIDIKSAYPYAMTHMPILTDGLEVRYVTEPTDEAEFGTYCLDVDVGKDSYYGPLAVNGGLLTFPVGRLKETWVDRNTLALLDELGVEYDLKKGVELHDPEAKPILAPLIHELFGLKESPKSAPAVSYASKIAMNGLYGKTIQLIDDTVVEEITSLEDLNEIHSDDIIHALDRFYARMHTGTFHAGGLFAPMYAAFTTGFTRRQILEKALEVGEDNGVAIHTDSVLMIGEYRGEVGSKLGEWELETVKDENGDKLGLKDCELKITKCGFYEIEKEGVKKVRSRGVGRTETIVQEEFIVRRRYGLNQAVRHDFERMNVIRDMGIKQDFNTDKKRVWEEELGIKTFAGGRFIDSRPIVVTA